jgi:hypothetical protein
MKTRLLIVSALALVLAPTFSIAAQAGGLQSLVQFGAHDVYILPKDCADAGLKIQQACDALHAGKPATGVLANTADGGGRSRDPVAR